MRNLYPVLRKCLLTTGVFYWVTIFSVVNLGRAQSVYEGHPDAYISEVDADIVKSSSGTRLNGSITQVSPPDEKANFEPGYCLENSSGSNAELAYRYQDSPPRALINVDESSSLKYSEGFGGIKLGDLDDFRDRYIKAIGCNGFPLGTIGLVNLFAEVEMQVQTPFATAQTINLQPITGNNQNFSTSSSIFVAQQTANSARFLNFAGQVNIISRDEATVITLDPGQFVTANSQGLGQPQTFDLQHLLNTGSLTAALIPGNNAAIEGLPADVQEIYRKAWPDIQATLDAQARRVESVNRNETSIVDVIDLREDIILPRF